ncbi:hypothetical protein D5400_16865 [Georhizobium profundi]|uniref:Uncharacterized protein n=1 Tax=Georhizobium profundi TaxID=2341112 RepID=A0A3Q8XSJ5_9HYPH|nr:hypothetical protein [Georhizobium profundi]AZN72722.1 hypothetical protein D5400_16865 [Georhizobium profundi]
MGLPLSVFGLMFAPMSDRPKAATPGTIGWLIDKHMCLTVYCNDLACQHRAEPDLQKLADRLGREHSYLLPKLGPKLKCSACGGKKIVIQVTPNGTMGYRG